MLIGPVNFFESRQSINCLTSLSDDRFINELSINNIKIDTRGDRQFRMATHFGFTNNDIEKVIKAIKFVLEK